EPRVQRIAPVVSGFSWTFSRTFSRTKNQRHERGRRLDVAVAERSRQLIPEAVAAGLGQRSTARGEDDDARIVRVAILGADGKTMCAALNARDAACRAQLSPCAVERADERVEN